jgi:hypothetical protein
MAGEFSFSISLSLGMLGLGVLAARAMRTGKYRSWAAVLLAAACGVARHRADLRGLPAPRCVFVVVWIDR